MTRRLRESGATIVLRRRGVVHGRFALSPPTSPGDARARWETDRPILLASLLAPRLARARAGIHSTLALFDGLRAGRVELMHEVRRRLAGRAEFFPSGATVDAGDAREL